MNEATLRFVRQHADDDVRMLALHAKKEPEVDLSVALEQIKGRQTARRKLPSWAAKDDIWYPVHLSMEQCSSEQTGRYKAELVSNLQAEGLGHDRFCDLTGGFGVDFSFLSPLFSTAVYVERQDALCRLARHNFEVLGLNATIVCDDGAGFLCRQDEKASLLFLDPARRDEHGGRTYGISDCTPDVIQLLPELLRYSDCVLLKLSPMLDWRKAVSDLGQDVVSEVHIVSVGGECKELLLVLSEAHEGLRLVCVNDEERFEVRLTADVLSVDSAEPGPVLMSDRPLVLAGSDRLFLYEPNASVMKAGCFMALSRRFGVQKLAQNSHLFVSESPVSGFPGRGFRVEAVTTLNKKELKRVLGGLRQANITVRNFPLSVADLRKRLKISEGGSVYIFATTLADGSHVLMLCQHL